MRLAALALCAFACAHARLEEVPLLVSAGVLSAPKDAARAPVLRDGLLQLMREDHFCLDEKGDYQGLLEVRFDDPPAVVLTLDDATQVRIDEVERSVPALPATPAEAAEVLRPLLHELAGSWAARDFAADALSRATPRKDCKQQ